jgi:hypothetical protein
MPRTDLHIKVELQYDNEEDPKKLAAEICRQLLKIYAVRNAEVSSITNQDY